ncbi:MAG: acyl carrier protein [Jatrophihabitantaceae bacterium]
MTAESPEVVAVDSWPYADIVAALCEVAGPDQLVAGQVRPSSRLEADLRLDSIELAALGLLLAERFGPAVQLTDLLAGLDFDRLIELTVGEVTDFAAGRLAGLAR